MKKGKFSHLKASESHPLWEKLIERKSPMYTKKDDIRSSFYRDYCRILHSKAYRRLKHKTQVFFATTNDHICTRIEHIHHVAEISQSYSKVFRT